MNNNLNISQLNDDKPEKSIGQIIKDERLRKAVSLIDASSKTKLKVAYLEAIERDDFDKLPAPIYAKNFIRIYANFLGLDGIAVSKKYNIKTVGATKLPPPAKTTSTYYISTFLHSLIRHPFMLLGFVVVIIIIFLYPGNSDNNNLDNSAVYPSESARPASLDDYQPVFDTAEPLPNS